MILGQARHGRGRGYGELLAQVLVAHPSARGVLFDMDHAITQARDYLAGRGLDGAANSCREISSRACPAAATCWF